MALRATLLLPLLLISSAAFAAPLSLAGSSAPTPIGDPYNSNDPCKTLRTLHKDQYCLDLGDNDISWGGGMCRTPGKTAGGECDIRCLDRDGIEQIFHVAYACACEPDSTGEGGPGWSCKIFTSM